MKSKITIVSLLILFLFSIGPMVSGFENPIEADNFYDLVQKIITYIFWISFPIAIFMLIMAGFYFVTAMGNEKQITTGKNILLYTFIGILIIILAKGVVELIQSSI